MIGHFPLAQKVSGYENQILIGHIRERNVIRKKSAICGEEHCVTSLKTAVKESRYEGEVQEYDDDNNVSIGNSTVSRGIWDKYRE